MPILDFSVYGNGKIQPGKKAKITWNTFQAQNPVDDSLPDEVIVFRVIHRYTPQDYRCFVTGGMVL